MLPDASLLRIGLLMIVATGVIQVVAQLVLSRMMDVLPSPPQSRYPRFYMMTHSVTAVVILMIGHILQVTMWALVYHDHWNEFVDLKSALYFSLASFTTLGATRPRAAARPPHDRRAGSGGRHADVRLVDRAAGGGGAAHRPPSSTLTGRPRMSDDVDSFIATAPKLDFAFAIKAQVGPIQDLGQTARGHRRIIDILGGEVHGPEASRRDPAGRRGLADRAARRHDRGRGALHHPQRQGRTGPCAERRPARGQSEILARMSEGELVPVGSYHFRTAPRFETAEPSLKWLERATFVGVAARTPDRVAIGFHEVL